MLEKDQWTSYIACYIMSLIIVIITICLIFIYIKTKDLHSYPCYFNILLSSVTSIDNILRLIPVYEDDNKEQNPNHKNLCKFQGFSLALLDKFMLTTITIFSIISFMGLVFYETYKKKEKCLFITLIFIGFLISLILAIIFVLNGVDNNDDVCYIKSKRDNETEKELKVDKEFIDLIATSILFAINLYCILHTLLYIYWEIKESKNNANDNRLKNFTSHFWKFVIILIVTILTFTMVILIIIDKFLGSNIIKSLCYVLCSLIVVIVYTINARVLKEGKKIILCKKENQRNYSIEEEDKEEEDKEEDDIEGIEIGNCKTNNLVGIDDYNYY